MYFEPDSKFQTSQVKQPVGYREISARYDEVARNSINPANIPLFAGFNSLRSGIPVEEQCYETREDQSIPAAQRSTGPAKEQYRVRYKTIGKSDTVYRASKAIRFEW